MLFRSSLADPTTGELRIGCPEMFIATLLVGIIEHFSAKYPQVTVHVQDVPPPAIRHPGLRERAYDLVIGGHHPQAPGDHSLDDLDMHYIVEDQMIIGAGMRSRAMSQAAPAIRRMLVISLPQARMRSIASARGSTATAM